MSAFLTVFIAIFLAELGDKTQLATVLFAADETRDRWVVFFSAASALIASTSLAIGLGVAAERWLATLPLQLIAGLGFLAIGVSMIVGHFQSA
ncbi:MAG: TMEM165/GDT1 family protein [Pseudomonadota bacterium]